VIKSLNGKTNQLANCIGDL